MARSGVTPMRGDDDVELVGEQVGHAVGAGDLLQLELHAERLGDLLGHVDIEARRDCGLASCEPKGGTSIGTPMRTMPVDRMFCQIVGPGRRRRPTGQRQGGDDAVRRFIEVLLLFVVDQCSTAPRKVSSSAVRGSSQRLRGRALLVDAARMHEDDARGDVAQSPSRG